MKEKRIFTIERILTGLSGLAFLSVPIFIFIDLDKILQNTSIFYYIVAIGAAIVSPLFGILLLKLAIFPPHRREGK